MPDFDNLPYTENPGPVTVTEAVILIALSGVMAGTNYFGVTAINPLIMIAPIALLLGLILLFRTIRNAAHGAIRRADADAALDDHVLEQVQRAASRTLTPAMLSAQLDGAS